ncbi:hypothetical protein E1B28_010346 [Marasmius oreades]|uniref:Nephrocystin 3-like N-terminal domain-containing protein n=1 Tax=Marasmius oreades TaxID=181124 RepID=A0A9P7RXL0_9AGAR|nr:uncharacterized protein E1B28_010346 [Marasmius oreades]KAG7091300.1 hypothetical protein E1B28_010346 [Marasmius oreades]
MAPTFPRRSRSNCLSTTQCQGGMSFTRSSKFRVVDSNLTSIQGDHNTTHNYYQNFSRAESGLSVLRSRVAFSALHDSEARYPQPNVLPGTREEIIQNLGRWSEDPYKENRVYWVNGAAGVGKSAIAQALSEKYIRSGHHAAAFFFSRNDYTRDRLDPFVATIAYQLATSKAVGPFIAPLINHIIRSMPEILDKNWEHQFRTLIEEPCTQVDPRQWLQLPRLVIIDGVDECIEVKSQKRLLQIIRNATPTLPLDFLIFSRPEPHISHTFRHESFIPSPFRMALGDFAVWDDIETYLRHEFARIREEHWDTLPSPQARWPGDNVIHQLLCKATGQFIYVTTVMKYIDTGKIPVAPGQRLEIILRAKRVVQSTSPYPDLDLLYSQILQCCVDEDGNLRKILQLIVSPFGAHHVLKSPFRLRGSSSIGLRSLCALEQLLDLSEGEAAALLSGLHSILGIPASRTEDVEVLHASFSDYLLDSHRAGVYHVGAKLSPQEWRQLLVVSQLRMLSRFCIESEPSPMHSRDHPLNGIHDADIGALNVWKYLYDNRRTIAINSEIAAALNAFDPHLYLATLLRWNYQLKLDGYTHHPSLQTDRKNGHKPLVSWYNPAETFEALDFQVSRFYGTPREWRCHTAAVHYQVTMLYSAFQLLKELDKSDKSSSPCLDKFFKRCSSLFRGFYVTFPRDQDKRSIQYTLFACQLSISRRIHHKFPNFKAIYHIMCLKATVGQFDVSLRILPSDNEDGRHTTIPAGWEVKYIDPAEGRLLRRLIELLVYSPLRRSDESQSEIASRIMDVFPSSEFENWTYKLAKLDWGKTWRAYLFGKLAQITQGKRTTSKVTFEHGHSDWTVVPVYAGSMNPRDSE